MKALILAAGIGSRLKPITEKIPKALTTVCGQPIINRQIDNLHSNGIDDVTIISGYKADILEKYVCQNYKNVKVLYNESYQTTNNMYSAYMAKEYFVGNSFVMMNGDVFFDDTILSELLKYPANNAIVTDIGNYLPESMKVIDSDGRLTHISKDVSKDDALGVSIDIYKFSPEGSNVFFSYCEEYIEHKGLKNLWSEVALNDTLADVDFKACPLKGRWMEIDNHDDLLLAEKIFQT